MPRDDGRVVACPLCGHFLVIWHVLQTVEEWRYDPDQRMFRCDEPRPRTVEEPHCAWCGLEFPRRPPRDASDR